MKNGPTRGSSSAIVPIPDFGEHEIQDCSHQLVAQEPQVQRGRVPLWRSSCWAGFGPSQCHCFCWSPMIIPGMAGEEQRDMENSREEKFPLQEPRSTLEATSHTKQDSATWVESKSSTARGLELDDHKGSFQPKSFYDSSWKRLLSPARAAQ